MSSKFLFRATILCTLHDRRRPDLRRNRDNPDTGSVAKTSITRNFFFLELINCTLDLESDVHLFEGIGRSMQDNIENIKLNHTNGEGEN